METSTLINIMPIFEKFNEKLEKNGYYSNSNVDKQVLKEAALEHFREGLAELYKNLGNELFQQKLLRKSSHMYSAAIALNGNNPVYYSNLCGALISMMDLSNAEEACKKGLEVAEEGSQMEGKLWWRLSRIYKESNRLQEGLNAINRALAIAPNSKDYISVKNSIETLLA